MLCLCVVVCCVCVLLLCHECVLLCCSVCVLLCYLCVVHVVAFVLFVRAARDMTKKTPQISHLFFLSKFRFALRYRISAP